MRHPKLLTLAAVALALCAGPAQAQTTLRYKFKEGEKLPYVLNTDMVITTTVAGMDIEMKFKQSADLNWQVQKVDSDGNARVRIKMGRVKMSMETPMGNVEYDSTSKDEPEGFLGQMIGKLGKAMANLEMTATVTPTGDLKDVEVPKDALKELKGIPGLDKLGGGMLSAEGMKDLLALPKLPKEAVTKGKKWSEKAAIGLPVGKAKGKTQFTYEGQVEKGGKTLEKIGVTSELKAEMAGDGAIPLKIKGQKSKGHAYLDNQAGRMLEFTNEGTIEMELEFGGNTIPQRITQNISLKLKKGAAK